MTSPLPAMPSHQDREFALVKLRCASTAIARSLLHENSATASMLFGNASEWLRSAAAALGLRVSADEPDENYTPTKEQCVAAAEARGGRDLVADEPAQQPQSDLVKRAMLRARKIVEDHIAVFGMVPHPDKLKEAIADSLEAAAVKQERSESRTVHERDDAQKCLSEMYHLVTGNDPEWSNQFGFSDALEDVSDALEAAASQPSELRIVFDGPPSHESGRFVEVENADGQSVNAGEWHKRTDGLWELRLKGSVTTASSLREQALVIAMTYIADGSRRKEVFNTHIGMDPDRVASWFEQYAKSALTVFTAPEDRIFTAASRPSREAALAKALEKIACGQYREAQNIELTGHYREAFKAVQEIAYAALNAYDTPAKPDAGREATEETP